MQGDAGEALFKRVMQLLGQAGSFGQYGLGSHFRFLASRDLELQFFGALFDSLLQLGLRSLMASPKLQGLARLALIDVLGQIRGDPAQIKRLPAEMKQLFDVLLLRRNQKIVADLKSKLKSVGPRGSIAVFYGAGPVSYTHLTLPTILLV